MSTNFTSEFFIPEGADSSWPFTVGRGKSYRPPKWNSQLFIWWGLLESLLRIQAKKPRQLWKTFPQERLEILMHEEGAGKEHPSRTLVASLIHEEESVLDVGCGAGAQYEVLAAAKKGKRYTGIDSSEPSIVAARRLYPDGNFLVGDAVGLVPQFGQQSFDIVLLRHVLEHLPDFLPALEQAITVSRRLAVFTFFLTPRRLPCGVRKLNIRIDPPFFTYVYSQQAIEHFLSKSGLYWWWHYNIGESRAGWLAGENNSVLIVSRQALSG